MDRYFFLANMSWGEVAEIFQGEYWLRPSLEPSQECFGQLLGLLFGFLFDWGWPIFRKAVEDGVWHDEAPWVAARWCSSAWLIYDEPNLERFANGPCSYSCCTVP
jgi:hypothetical protein